MQYKVLTTLFLAATALAAPADPTATSSGTETADSDETYDISDVPSSIMSVLATAIPASWYDEIIDPASRSVIISEAAAGTYPAWYNALPSSVKAWATSNFDDQLAGVSATASATGTQTETADSSAIETGSTTPSRQTSNAAVTTSASTTASGSTSISSSSSDSSSDSSSSIISSPSSASSSDSSSSSSSPSSSQSTGGAPAPTGGIAMGVAGMAGVLALALAL
ncbi:hypothetical protein DTO013E5_1496 [Penicillium roqueforti]|uniref:Genomic scaffold, ProqFM164S03 n=1 Tax=Penicillium roqueforti (strain FM164) TaxID=1365484 RepID=W6QVX6_PENRF|nr:uncharacterized protein LCP9604111_4951 [Penicillium roqueforti]CDM33727.1 unnamed protein product [Penicillium roqueforti FM164]KAF9248712.1 hypothetical protein LCP9604111_4951 [Penicillium roqueforti]KAI2681733.1 hypothetical protein CBS147355_2943 [Penicillium roqueforti]KAI2689123.1 hypothetical protein LCP963914a_2212 [Penicillium roqueforti]KAI2703821.1 hypothetical protein CBS147372_2290 [Penicillium roqueforti]